MSAATYQGIDYAAIPAAFSLLGLPRYKWARLFDSIRVMERAAARVLNTREDDADE
jgi:hypothetical protein